MANVHDVNTYTAKFTESYFLDTNIWIYIFCPLANNRRHEQRVYSNFYKSLIQSRGGIFVNSLVLSEFANAYLRIDFNLWKKDIQNYTADYKRDFVGSARFNETVVDVKQAIQSILSKSERMTDDFNSINLDGLFAEFGSCDFNDAYYLVLASSKGWKIVTHDADFFKDNSLHVEVITANL